MKTFFVSLTILLLPTVVTAQMKTGESLTEKQASHFASLALKCVSREFPNKPEHVINNASEVSSPKVLHPAFYGCYDWHSSVHGHWMLVRLLKMFPNLPESAQVRAALGANLTAENIQAEVAYMKQANRQSFERTYGWAWSENLQLLSETLTKSYLNFLPKQTYPIRTGVHPNTAFGLAFALDYAKAVGDRQLEALLDERSRTYYAKDIDYPGGWEPGGEDFFSAALMEADLMRRVMKPAEFATWFHKFLPAVAKGGPSSLLQPAIVTDRSDPKLVHLDGLNLSRAWCMRSIAAGLPVNDPARKILSAAADKHAAAALAHVASGDYAGEHWLASFAVYLLSVR